MKKLEWLSITCCVVMIILSLVFGAIAGLKALSIEQDVTRAMELFLLYIRPSGEITTVTAEYTTPATQLRRAADRIEKQDSDILFIEQTLKKWKHHLILKEGK